MTRLPWQHTRSRTKSGSEKTNSSSAQDWFSRTTTEPSRQALTDLVKAHNRGKSDESSVTGLRSRTNTVTSTLSQRARSRSGSSDEEAWSRPSSRGAYDESIHYSSDRPEAHKKVLLSKGSRLLKRTSSRMSLSSVGSSSTLGLTSPSRSSRVSSSTTRADDIRSKISAPFDFQHITHTEETQFSGLRRIEESTLADQYIAAINRQHPAPSLRGITASDLESTASDGQHYAITSNGVTHIPNAISPELPQTPPRPQPPPKDHLIFNTTPIDAGDPLDERCLDATALKWLAAHDDNVVNISDTQDNPSPATLNKKPLPDLPVVHAITTEDDTARPVTVEQSPSPPLAPASSTPNVLADPDTDQQRQRFPIKHRASMLPSSKSSMPNLLATSSLLAPSKMLPRHHSDMALSQQAKSLHTGINLRTSTSFAAIDTLNWEDAVDEAWDMVDDDDARFTEGSFLSLSSDKAQNDPSTSEMMLTESASSTPLMMMPASGASTRSPDRVCFPLCMEAHPLESVKEDEPSVELAGLGISPCPAAGTAQPASRLSRSSSAQFPRRRSSLSYQGNEALTRSSSQESIILSIASSIVGTQRSSNSSVSAVDLESGRFTHGGEMLSGCNFQEDRECEEEPVGAARPESGCLPPDILDQLSHFGNTSTTDHASTSEDIPPVPPVPSVLSIPGHTYGKSAPKLLVPERRSSIVATSHSGPIRKRSSTWGNRPRQSSHASYSLFPVAQTSSCMAVTSP